MLGPLSNSKNPAAAPPLGTVLSLVLSGLIGLACTAGDSSQESHVFSGDISHRMADDIPTVATVTWEIDREDVIRSWVEFGEDGLFNLSTPVVEGGVGERLLLGMHGNSDINYRIVADFEGEQLSSSVYSFETGNRPSAELPNLTVQSTEYQDTLGGYVLLSMLMTDGGYPVIVDGNGEYIWWWIRPEDNWETTYVPRTYFSRDGQSVVYMAVSGLISGDGVIVRVSLEGIELVAYPIDKAHHDFVELPDGSFAVLVEDSRTVNDTVVKGDAILIIDPEGGEEEIWNAWDTVEFDPEFVSDDGTGWTHANALDYDEAEDCFYVSLRNLSSIHKISRKGETLWRFGGQNSDFALSDGTTYFFDRQHQFEVTEDSIVVFSNNSPALAYSEVLEYSLNEESNTTELLWSYRHDPDLYTLAFGAAERIHEGNTLVTWTTAGLAQVVNEDGQAIWNLQSDFGGGLSYMHWTPDLYHFQE